MMDIEKWKIGKKILKGVEGKILRLWKRQSLGDPSAYTCLVPPPQKNRNFLSLVANIKYVPTPETKEDSKKIITSEPMKE